LRCNPAPADRKSTPSAPRRGFARGHVRADTFTATFPEAIGRDSASLDIHHEAGGMQDLRSRYLQTIRDSKDVAQEVQEAEKSLD
jgi:hypothetical protein